MMRTLTIAAAAFVLAATALAASTAKIVGSNGPDILNGTAAADKIYGKAGVDRINGRGGPDIIYPGPGKDRVYCGAGRDIVHADAADVVAKDCEVVRRPPPAAAPPAPQPPPDPLGSRTNPHPVGTTVTGQTWSVKINSVTDNATAAVMAANQFNDPPATGRQFFIVNLTVTYVGTATASIRAFDLTSRLGLLGSANVLYREYPDWCGVIPDELDSNLTLFTGGSGTGNRCWSVPSGEVASLLLMHDQGIFWALH